MRVKLNWQELLKAEDTVESKHVVSSLVALLIMQDEQSGYSDFLASFRVGGTVKALALQWIRAIILSCYNTESAK